MPAAPEPGASMTPGGSVAIRAVSASVRNIAAGRFCCAPACISGCGLDLDFFCHTRWGRNGIAKLAHGFQMSLDCLADVALRVFDRSAGGDAARQIGNI